MIGNIYLWHGKGIISRLIRFFTKSHWNHVGIIANEKKDRVLIYEALGNGFKCSWYEKEWINNRIKENVVKIGTPKKELIDVLKICKKYEDRPYGFIGIWNILINTILGKDSILYKKGDKKLICSEGVVRVLYDASNKKIDFEKEFKKDFDEITPHDISISKQIWW